MGNLIAKEAPEKNQDEKDEEEAKKQRDASWKKMKLTLMVFGVSFGLLGGYMVFVLGAPEKDMEGKDIRDEFTDMPLVKQFFLRTYRELDYYRRVGKNRLKSIRLLTYSRFSSSKNRLVTNYCPIRWNIPICSRSTRLSSK